jgi:hypothetical protein
MDYVGRTCAEGCFFGGVELKVTEDMANTGYRYSPSINAPIIFNEFTKYDDLFQLLLPQ